MRKTRSGGSSARSFGVWMMCVLGLGFAVASTPRALADEVPKVGWIELADALREGPVPFAWVAEADAGPSLASVLAQMEHVERGEAYAGLVVYLNQPALSLAQASALRRALAAVRASGKTVLVFAETYDLLDLYLASVADRVLLQTHGSVSLPGLAIEEMYLGQTLEKIGVEADLIQIGQFKGADEQFSRTGPSEAWDANIDGVLDGLYDHLVGSIAAGRGMDRGFLESLMPEAMAMTDEALVASGLIDAATERSMFDETEAAFGEEFAWDDRLGEAGRMSMPDNPFALFSMLIDTPNRRTTGPTIAVVHAYGPIVSGESAIGDGLFSEQTIGSETIEAAFIDALEDDNIQGVVLRIDSPGGSALASEMIFQAMEEVGADKPVFASVGGMAASGGYYLVCGAERVFVEPGTIVGSIGVVGGKLIMPGLYEWAGVGIQRRSRGPGGDLFNSVEPFTDDQRAIVERSMRVVYDQFLERVVQGRGDRLADLDAIDEGMLFTGTQALANGMADDLGGLHRAVAALGEMLGLNEGDYDVLHLPRPISLPDYLNGVFGVRGPAVATDAMRSSPASLAWPQVAALRELLGPARWAQASRLLEGLIQLREESVLLLHPSALRVSAGRD